MQYHFHRMMHLLKITMIFWVEIYFVRQEHKEIISSVLYDILLFIIPLTRVVEYINLKYKGRVLKTASIHIEAICKNINTGRQIWSKK